MLEIIDSYANIIIIDSTANIIIIDTFGNIIIIDSSANIFIITYEYTFGFLCALEPWYACAYREFLWAGGCCALLAHIRWLTALS